MSQLSELPIDTQTNDVRWFEIPPEPKVRKSFSVKHLLIVTAIVAALVAVAVFLFGTKRDPVFDTNLITDIQISRNLEHDKLTMWKTVPNKKGDFHVSPVSSINASRRVFESLKSQFVGKNQEEIRELIGYVERPQYGYNGAFFGVDQHAYVYRFDCGRFGWQYNLYLDENRIVTHVEYLWIY